MIRIGRHTVMLAAILIAGCLSSHTSTSDDPNDAGGVSPHLSACRSKGPTFEPSNFPNAAISWSTLGDIDLVQDCSFDTDRGTVSCLNSDTASLIEYQQIVQPGSGKIAVFAACSWRFEPSSKIKVVGALPLVIYAVDTIELDSLLSASPDGVTAVAGGAQFPSLDSKGLGPGGGGPSTDQAAGGGGGFCGQGGAGVGSSGDLPSPGGTTYGTSDLVPLVGGSSGGAGGGDGAAGGAVQLVAGMSILVGQAGMLQVGGDGARPNSGGGSGGAILLEAPSVTITGVLAANGGGGGAGQSGHGGNGTPDSNPAVGAVDSIYHVMGGNGSAGEATNGMDGIESADWKSGGGGGAGRIRINTSTGAATVTGTISPALTTTCATQGTLHPLFAL